MNHTSWNIRLVWLLFLLLVFGTATVGNAQQLYHATHNFGEPTFHYDGQTGAF